MAISFNQIPSAIRVPFVYVEFDNSRAVRGAQSKPYKALLIGQKLSTGSAPAEQLTPISNASQAAQYFGAGSMLSQMAEAWFKANSFTEVLAVALDDASAGVKAAGAVTFTGTATAAGTLAFYMGGEKVSVAVANGDTAAQVATAFAAAITALTSRIVDAAVDGSVNTKVNITFKHKGLVGNSLDLRFNYQSGEAFPAGVTAAVTAMSGGTLNPDVDDAFAAMGDDQYDVLAVPYIDSDNETKINAELELRFGPLKQTDGRCYNANNVAFGSLTTFGETKNSKHIVTLGVPGSPWSPWKWAAATAGVVAFYAAIDPARPLQTLEIPGAMAPALNDRLTLSERNTLLYSGISTFKVVGDTCVIERLITRYRLNNAGGSDPSYLNVEILNTLSYLRWDWRNYILNKYPRHKLASDGIRVGPGQAIVTPKSMKAEAVTKFRQWEELGYVEGFDQFVNDLIVERNAQDTERLDVDMSPDMVNGLRILGTKLGFLL